MATPIENNTEALKALKAKADSLPGKAANVLKSADTAGSMDTIYKNINFRSESDADISLECYINDSQSPSVYSLKKGEETVIENADFSRNIRLMCGGAENVYLMDLSFKDGMADISVS